MFFGRFDFSNWNGMVQGIINGKKTVVFRWSRMLASLLIFFKRIWGEFNEFNECGAKYATKFK